MARFTGEDASNYDQRITRLVPGYELLHQATAAQLRATLDDEATILIVGAGTGKEVIELATANPNWHFIAQDISEDMLNIAKQQFAQHNLTERVTIHCGDLRKLNQQADAALCLLVLHFVADDGDKKALLQAIKSQMKKSAQLYLVDFMRPETSFEREAQLLLCQQYGLSEAGMERMKYNLEHEFYTLDRIRLAELLNEARFATPKQYFKLLGVTGYVAQA